MISVGFPIDVGHLFRSKPAGRSGAAIAEWATAEALRWSAGALELLKAAFEAAGPGTQAFARWWNSARVRSQRKPLRPDIDNLASIARAVGCGKRAPREGAQVVEAVKTGVLLAAEQYLVPLCGPATIWQACCHDGITSIVPASGPGSASRQRARI